MCDLCCRRRARGSSQFVQQMYDMANPLPKEEEGSIRGEYRYKYTGSATVTAPPSLRRRRLAPSDGEGGSTMRLGVPSLYDTCSPPESTSHMTLPKSIGSGICAVLM